MNLWTRGLMGAQEKLDLYYNCENTFPRFSDLEIHIKVAHEKYQQFHCDICKKRFVLKWRLQKHMKIHSNKNCQPFHYFNNGKMCPFEELGCKFLHIGSKFCRFGQECDNKMCPFRHSKESEPSEANDTNTKLNDVEISDMEDNDSPDKIVNFVTSTPRKIDCEECKNQSQCVDCFVRQENPEHFAD